MLTDFKIIFGSQFWNKIIEVLSKRIVSLTIPDFYEPVDVETGLMNMTPNKVGEYFSVSDINLAT